MRGKGEKTVMSTAHFSKGGQFFQYDDENEFNNVIERLHQVMKCDNDEGISDFLGINTLDVIHSKINKSIPIEWFKRFFFSIYVLFESEEQKNNYKDKDYFNKKYKEFIYQFNSEMLEEIVKSGKAAMLSDNSMENCSDGEIKDMICEYMSKYCKYMSYKFLS